MPTLTSTLRNSRNQGNHSLRASTRRKSKARPNIEGLSTNETPAFLGSGSLIRPEEAPLRTSNILVGQFWRACSGAPRRSRGVLSARRRAGTLARHRSRPIAARDAPRHPRAAIDAAPPPRRWSSAPPPPSTFQTLRAGHATFACPHWPSGRRWARAGGEKRGGRIGALGGSFLRRAAPPPLRLASRRGPPPLAFSACASTYWRSVSRWGRAGGAGGGGRIAALGGSFVRRAAAATAAAGNAPRPAYPCPCYLRICVLSVGVTLGMGLLLGGRWLAGGVRRCWTSCSACRTTCRMSL